jgi:hypothetical protein
MGAAVASLGMLTLKTKGWNVVEVYSFGSPRFANAALASRFDAMLRGQFFRITHGKDPFVDMPPGPEYVHVEPEVFYTGSTAQGYVLCDKPDDEKCSAQNFKNTSSMILMLFTDLIAQNFSDVSGEVVYHKSYMDIGMSCLAHESPAERSIDPLVMMLLVVLWCLGGLACRVSYAVHHDYTRRVSKLPSGFFDGSCQHSLLDVEGDASRNLYEPLVDSVGASMI